MYAILKSWAIHNRRSVCIAHTQFRIEIHLSCIYVHGVVVAPKQIISSRNSICTNAHLSNLFFDNRKSHTKKKTQNTIKCYILNIKHGAWRLALVMRMAHLRIQI